MMENDFIFSCGPVAHQDDNLEQFLAADPQSVHNPLPYLASPQDFSQYRTQPLVRMYYWASPDPLNDILNVLGALKFGHEVSHLDNDDTPAKCFARYLQGHRFVRMNDIVWAETWNTEVANNWDALREATKLISAIANRILLSEELLATAESFVKAEQVAPLTSTTAYWRRELRQQEEEALEYFEDEERRQLFPDFRDFYSAIKKVMTWVKNDKPDSLDPFLRIFLQGLRSSYSPETGIWVADSHQQCQLLAEQVKKMDSAARLIDWLREMIRQQDLVLTGLALDEKLAKESKGTVAEDLWIVTRQVPKSPEDLYGPEKVSFHSTNYFFHRRRLSIFVFPRLLGTQWYIQPVVLQPRGENWRVETDYYLETEPVMVVLKLEAILEQLLARDGICCPYYRYSRDMPRPCPCRPEWKRALLRLLQWAREGKFGPDGKWRDLPPECSREN